jgi:hypothetical protein
MERAGMRQQRDRAAWSSMAPVCSFTGTDIQECVISLLSEALF